MMVMILAALLTAATVIILLTPLMLRPDKGRQGWLLLAAISLGAMGIYLAQGAPGLPSQPAMFETNGENFERRELVKQELAAMEALAGAPQDVEKMLALGSIRMQTGRLQQAISVLNMARAHAPDHDGVREKLGAAHYAAALSTLLLDEDRSQAARHFNEALAVAPATAPYRERLLRDMQAFEAEEDMQ